MSKKRETTSCKVNQDGVVSFGQAQTGSVYMQIPVIIRDGTLMNAKLWMLPSMLDKTREALIALGLRKPFNHRTLSTLQVSDLTREAEVTLSLDPTYGWQIDGIHRFGEISVGRANTEAVSNALALLLAGVDETDKGEGGNNGDIPF